MKTREDMIERLVEHRIDCWYEWKPYEIADLFRSLLSQIPVSETPSSLSSSQLFFHFLLM